MVVGVLGSEVAELRRLDHVVQRHIVSDVVDPDCRAGTLQLGCGESCAQLRWGSIGAATLTGGRVMLGWHQHGLRDATFGFAHR